MTVKYTLFTCHSKKWIRFSGDTISPIARPLFTCELNMQKLFCNKSRADSTQGKKKTHVGRPVAKLLPTVPACFVGLTQWTSIRYNLTPQ